MNTNPLDTDPAKALHDVKIAARAALGLVWIYEGLVPKILFLDANPAQTELVRRSGIFWPTPEATLVALGVAQIVMGVVLLIGWWERKMVVLATAWMGVLILLVAGGRHAMLIDPFGALAKDLCLMACAFTVWKLGGKNLKAT